MTVDPRHLWQVTVTADNGKTRCFILCEKNRGGNLAMRAFTSLKGHLTRKPYGCFRCPGNKLNAVLMWFVFCGMICMFSNKLILILLFGHAANQIVHPSCNYSAQFVTFFQQLWRICNDSCFLRWGPNVLRHSCIIILPFLRLYYCFINVFFSPLYVDFLLSCCRNWFRQLALQALAWRRLPLNK